MKKILQLLLLLVLGLDLSAQSFEVGGLQDSYKGFIGETIKVPLSFRNTSARPVSIVIRKAGSVIGTSQKNYFCLDGNCLDQRVEDYSIRIEPGQTLSALQIALESGLIPGVSNVRYFAYNRHNPTEQVELDLSFVVDEKPVRQNIYTSPHITIQDVYPNPSSDYADVDYQILGEPVKAKIVLHNVLGTPIGEYELSSSENKVKIRTEDLKEGVYFYTLYVDREAVITQKLVVNR